jgi:alkylation response protein AidB-like acyl-CoA dehydrogenase
VPTGHGLYVVDAAAGGVARHPVVSLDITRPLTDLTFTDAPATLLAAGPPARTAVREALLAGAGLLASEQVGIAEWCLDSAVRHLRERTQFGRPLGSFQALKHRLADVWSALTQARAVARYAAGCLSVVDGAPSAAEARVAVSLAQAHCAEVAVLAAQECVQLHGGIGFTWEHPAHLYLKRAKADALALGTADQHRGLLAELVDLPARGGEPARSWT